MIKNKPKNIFNSKKNNINLILGVTLIVIFFLFVLPSDKSPLYSPEDFTSISYNNFEEISNELISGQYGLVQLSQGEITPDGQFISYSRFIFDTTQSSQIDNLLQNIRNYEGSQTSFQLSTNFMTPFQQNYYASAGSKGGEKEPPPKKIVNHKCKCYANYEVSWACRNSETGVITMHYKPGGGTSSSKEYGECNSDADCKVTPECKHECYDNAATNEGSTYVCPKGETVDASGPLNFVYSSVCV